MLLLVAVGALTSVHALAAGDVVAEARAERPKLVESFPDAFAPVIDDPKLPRVLLIGDSISIGYTPAVRELLRGVANVHRIPDNGGPTSRGVAMLDEWLGRGRWDVIHFNFGLHDIARGKDGSPRTTLIDYERNLRALVGRLRASGARLVWATTTPVPDTPNLRPLRRRADAMACNAVARKVMAEAGISVDDLHGAALPRLAEIQQPANVHFTPAGYRSLAECVVASIRAQLVSR